MLSAGTRLGPYEIISPIGAGGMGEVFKARDTRLDRIVAIKTSAAQFSERFEREARAIAAINHPHICQLYDVGPDYLVMEYLEGAPLRGPLPLDKALEYGRQICDALDAAHRKGIVHRDLKPGNILVTRTGVKLLDFGLAKMAQKPVVGDETLTQAMTGQGMIVGTLYYMSPEQVQGKDTDARSDIFSFGIVLYEMLTGKRIFDGDNPASVISSILTTQMPAISGVAPASVDRVLKRCLNKDPEERWQNARDLMFELASPGAPVESTTAPSDVRKRWIAVAIAVLLAVASVLAIVRLVPRETRNTGSDWRVSIAPPAGSNLWEIGDLSFATPEISPDGSMVVASIGDGLSLRRLNSTTWAPLRTTANAQQVFWSADSKSIGFYQNRRWMKMHVPDGAPEVIHDSPGFYRGGDWNVRDVVLTAERGLWIKGPRDEKAINLLPEYQEHLVQPTWPHFLPDGERFVFSAYDPQTASEPSEGRGIYLAQWRDGQWKLKPTRLKASSSEARYSPAGGGRLLFVQNDNLYAQKLNLAAAHLEGEPQLVVQGVASSATFGNAHFSVSAGGELAWRPGRAAVSQLTWFDRKGTVLGTTGPADAWANIQLSPDERRIAAMTTHAIVNEFRVLEADRNGFTRLAASSSRLLRISCLWLPGSDQILYTERAIHDTSMTQFLMQQAAGGGNVHEVGQIADSFLDGISADGKKLLTWDPANALQVFAFPPDGSKPRKVTADGGEARGTISPDGTWVAYAAGRNVFVQPLGASGARRQISLAHGWMPVWRADGKEILYISDNQKVFAVSADTSRGEFGTATALFSVRFPSMVSQSCVLAVTRDGSRILFAQAVEQPESNLIHIAADWTKGVRQSGIQ